MSDVPLHANPVFGEPVEQPPEDNQPALTEQEWRTNNWRMVGKALMDNPRKWVPIHTEGWRKQTIISLKGFASTLRQGYTKALRELLSEHGGSFEARVVDGVVYGIYYPPAPERKPAPVVSESQLRRLDPEAYALIVNLARRISALESQLQQAQL